MIRTALVFVSLCIAAHGAAEEQFVVVPNPAFPGEVPAGSRSDQILWRDARDAMVEGNEQIKIANMALSELHYARLDLDELEKDGSPADMDRLRAIRTRLDGPAKALASAVPHGPLGGCRYSLLHFEQSMGAEPGTELGDRLPVKRAEATKCRDDFRVVLSTLPPAVKEVRAALTEVAPELQRRLAARRESATTRQTASAAQEASR